MFASSDADAPVEADNVAVFEPAAKSTVKVPIVPSVTVSVPVETALFARVTAPAVVVTDRALPETVNVSVPFVAPVNSVPAPVSVTT